MIDVDLALSYLNNGLWNESIGAFREATSIEKYYRNDNTLARLVMRKHDPHKAQVLTDGLLKDYNDPRWCIFEGNLTDFIAPASVLPDYLRYADLVELQYLYQYLNPTDMPPSTSECFGVLSKMYGLKHAGYIYDMATPREAYTMYKLLLFGICALKHEHVDLVGELLKTVSQFQVKSDNQDTIRNWREDEIGGIKTEYIPPDWEGLYPHLLVLANCETTSLAILLQEAYDHRRFQDAIMIGSGLLVGTVGGLSLAKLFK